jgi:hypothetical protein
MPKDLLAVQVTTYSPEFKIDEPVATTSVGLSELDAHLISLFGDDVPSDPLDRNASSDLLRAMADFSTNQRWMDMRRSYDTITALASVTEWTKVFSSVVESSQELGDRTDNHLTVCEAGKKEVSNDTTYLVGLFDLSSFVVASQVAIRHPRANISPLMIHAFEATPQGHSFVNPGEMDAFAFSVMADLVPRDVGEEMRSLRSRGLDIVRATERNIGRLLSLVEAMRGKE